MQPPTPCGETNYVNQDSSHPLSLTPSLLAGHVSVSPDVLHCPLVSGHQESPPDTLTLLSAPTSSCLAVEWY